MHVIKVPEKQERGNMAEEIFEGTRAEKISKNNEIHKTTDPKRSKHLKYDKYTPQVL